MKHFVDYQLDIDKGNQNTTDSTYKQLSQWLFQLLCQSKIRTRDKIQINNQLPGNVPFRS